MRRKMALFIVLAVVALVGGIAILGGALARQTIERAVANELTTAIGPARSYSVHASGSLKQLARGEMTGLRIRGRDVQLSSGVIVDELDVNADGLVMDLRSRQIVSVRKTCFVAQVSEAGLNNYLVNGHPEVPGLSIALADGSLTLRGRPRMLGIKVPVQLDGTMRVSSGTRLMLDLHKLKAVGVKTPGFVRNSIERRINPVMDTTDWAFPTTLTSATITDGKLTVKGNLNLVSHKTIEPGSARAD